MNFPLISHIKPPYSDPNFDSSYLPLSLLALTAIWPDFRSQPIFLACLI